MERVEVFKYLGRLLAYDDNDAQAVRGNLKKAPGVWARLSRTIRAGGIYVLRIRSPASEF